MIGKPVTAAFSFYPATAALATAAALGSTIVWGVSTPVAKLALVDWPPLLQAWVRFAIALAVLIPWLLMKRQRVALGRGPALLGLLGVGLFYALHNIGLQLTSAINSSLILDGGTPILTVLMAALVLKERPQRLALIGLIASFAGVAAVIVGANRTLGAVGYGELIMLASAALWAVYSIIGRRIFAAHGVLPVVTAQRCTVRSSWRPPPGMRACRADCRRSPRVGSASCSSWALGAPPSPTS
jgi:drug/metabolite transporter (DMT)-like permease